MALVKDEPGGRRVQEAIAADRPRMSSVNLGEVYYSLVGTHGRRVANEWTLRIREAVEVEDPDWELVRAAAEVKARGGVSYADAFCIATASRHRMPLMTGDPEIVERAEGVEVLDLRSPDR
jgi:PIN domain nuclease of toxin-antitoxin system